MLARRLRKEAELNAPVWPSKPAPERSDVLRLYPNCSTWRANSTARAIALVAGSPACVAIRSNTETAKDCLAVALGAFYT
jgi:hypothetical protein